MGGCDGPYPVDAGGVAAFGIDYDHDGKISPFGPPDDALASTARYFVERGKYRRGEHWGYEVRMPAKMKSGGSRSYAAWQALGVTRADGEAFPQPKGDRQSVGAGARAGRPSSSGRIFTPCALTIPR